MNEEIRKAVLDFFGSKKLKKRFPVKEIVTAISAFDKRDVKSTIIAMTDNDEIKVWSSGSSVYYMMPEDYESQLKEEQDMN